MFGNDVFGMCQKENEGKEKVFELSTNLFFGANQTKHNSSAFSWAERAKTGRRWARSNCIISNKGSKIFITKRFS